MLTADCLDSALQPLLSCHSWKFESSHLLAEVEIRGIAACEANFPFKTRGKRNYQAHNDANLLELLQTPARQ